MPTTCTRSWTGCVAHPALGVCVTWQGLTGFPRQLMRLGATWSSGREAAERQALEAAMSELKSAQGASVRELRALFLQKP